MESKKFLLQEREIPQAWYNIIPDMASKPLPLIHPARPFFSTCRDTDSSTWLPTTDILPTISLITRSQPRRLRSRPRTLRKFYSFFFKVQYEISAVPGVGRHWLLLVFVSCRYLVRVMMNVAIEISVPTDDSPSDSAGGTFHDERAFELLGST